MKFTISLLILFTINSFHALSQKIHVQAGSSFSAFIIQTDDNKNTSDYLTGFAFHAGVDYLTNKHFTLAANIGLLRKGFYEYIETISVEYDNPSFESGAFEIKLHKDYFEINNLISYHFLLNEKIIPFINTGPYIDISIGGDDYFDNKNLYGLIIGGGFKFNLKKYRLGLVFNYNWDFTKLSEEDYLLPDSYTDPVEYYEYHQETKFKTFSLQLFISQL